MKASRGNLGQRNCSKTGCGRPAVATLTYAYSDLTAVVGPLATVAEPHSYDLCQEHALRLTVPRGWEVMRHEGEFPLPEVEEEFDDLEALADAVREATGFEIAAPAAGAPAPTGQSRRAHLRVVRSLD